MIRPLYIFLLLLATVNITFAADAYNAAWWKKANGFYNSKQYDSALVYFEKIASLSPQNEEVYYNLGNTFYRLNQIGPAVLNYERALKLKPTYKEAQDNLLLAQSRIPNRIPIIEEIFFVRWWHSITAASTATAWAVISLLLFVLFIVLLIARRLRKVNWLPSQAIAFISVAWLVVLLISIVAAVNKQNSKKAVVMQSDAPLLSDPDKGKIQSLVPEGTTVQWEEDGSTWVQVKLPDGREGYMQRAHMVKI